MATDFNKLKLDVNEPDIFKKRSYIPNLKHGSHFTCNASDLVPMDAAWPVIPGDTWKLRQTTFIRMSNPPKTPTMDQLVVDYYYFFTPYRILDGKFDDFITGNKGTQWNNLSTETAMYIGISVGATGTGDKSHDISGSLYDYLHMLPAVVKTNTSTSGATLGFIQAYPVMNYYRIWNEYFRAEAFQAEIAGTYSSGAVRLAGNISLSDVVLAKSGYRTNYGVGLSNPPSIFNGILCETCRLGDYFSTALPAPVKGGETAILESLNLTDPLFLHKSGSNYVALDGTIYGDDNVGKFYDNSTNTVDLIKAGATAIGSNTITALKQAFAIDAIKTLDARYGQKITDYTYGHFGVVLPDYRVPRPEFLGKRRFYFNINQVIQSSETTATSPQGNAGAWGQTLDKKQYIFTKSFTEFGMIQGVMTIRVLNHSYAQGLDRQFLKFNRFDFYDPALANISDLPVRKVEMYLPKLTNTVSLSQWIDAVDNSAWGFQEAWSEYKYMPNRVAGLMSPLPSTNLSQWTYTDNYASEPTLNSRWLIEPINNIDNTLMIPSTTAPQFIVDIFFDIDAYRPMPLHSDIGVIKGW